MRFSCWNCNSLTAEKELRWRICVNLTSPAATVRFWSRISFCFIFVCVVGLINSYRIARRLGLQCILRNKFARTITAENLLLLYILNVSVDYFIFIDLMNRCLKCTFFCFSGCWCGCWIGCIVSWWRQSVWKQNRRTVERAFRRWAKQAAWQSWSNLSSTWLNNKTDCARA